MSDTSHTEEQSTVLQTTREFFDQLDISPDIGVNYDPETEYYTIQIDNDNPGLLIGYRGDTLGAIQYYVSQALRTQTGDWLKLIVTSATTENSVKKLSNSSPSMLPNGSNSPVNPTSSPTSPLRNAVLFTSPSKNILKLPPNPSVKAVTASSQSSPDKSLLLLDIISYCKAVVSLTKKEINSQLRYTNHT